MLKITTNTARLNRILWSLPLSKSTKCTNGKYSNQLMVANSPLQNAKVYPKHSKPPDNVRVNDYMFPYYQGI